MPQFLLFIVFVSLAAIDMTEAFSLPLHRLARPIEDQLEDIMFKDKQDAAVYRNQCGQNWHEMFEHWELQQKRSKHGGANCVVWRCLENCGGLGDRLRGILTSFTLALVTDRAFFIDNPSPAPLADYFHIANPAVSWAFDQTLLHGASVLEENFMNHLTPPLGLYSSANLSRYLPYDIILQNNNFWRPFEVLHNPTLNHVETLRSFPDHVLAGCILNYLLVPRADVQSEIQRVKNEIASQKQQVLAVQIRTGDGQAKDNGFLRRLLSHYARCVNDIQLGSNVTYRVFLTTDSEDVVHHMQSIYHDVLTFAGQIFHVDGIFGAPDSPSGAFKKVVLDHIMISQAHQLIISRSGFAELAAVRGFRAYYTPLDCDFERPVEHYKFPVEQPQSVLNTNCLLSGSNHNTRLDRPVCN